jgi:hypothetical protein
MNSKAILVYILLLVVVAALVFFLLPKSNTQNATTSTTTATTTATSNQTSSASTTSTTTVAARNYSSCISVNQNVSIFNSNFSTGTYAGWSSIGLGFGTVPTNISKANANQAYYSHPWQGATSGFFATNYQGGLQVVGGNLTSTPFLVTEPYLNFKIISTQSSLLYIQILSNSTPVITSYFNSYRVPGNGQNATSTFVNASISLLPLICKYAQIKVTANTGLVTGGNANLNYIAVTDFYLSKKAVSAQGVLVNQSLNLSR